MLSSSVTIQARLGVLAIALIVLFAGLPSLAQEKKTPFTSGKSKAREQAAPSESSSLSAKNKHESKSLLPPASSESAELSVAPDVYQIGIEDELQIAVWREPELSVQSAVVRPDGMITMPLVNDVRVVGLTTKDLQALLTEKLKAFVNDPQVTVIVRTIRSRRVYLIGGVSRSGAYPLNGRKTVLQLLAESGGLDTFARVDSIYILRNEGGREIKIPFNYKRVLGAKSDKNGDVVLLPGDIVVVP